MKKKKVNDKISYINLHNKDCLIKGGKHNDMDVSMYIDIFDKIMTVKCKHPECFCLLCRTAASRNHHQDYLV